MIHILVCLSQVGNILFHNHGRADFNSLILSIQISTAGSFLFGKSPGFDVSMTSFTLLLFILPSPDTKTVSIPIAFAAWMFFMLSSTMTHSKALTPIVSSTFWNASFSGLQDGRTSSTAKILSFVKTVDNPSSFNTLNTYFLGPLENATSLRGHDSIIWTTSRCSPPSLVKSSVDVHHSARSAALNNRLFFGQPSGGGGSLPSCGWFTSVRLKNNLCT